MAICYVVTVDKGNNWAGQGVRVNAMIGRRAEEHERTTGHAHNNCDMISIIGICMTSPLLSDRN